MVHTGSVTKVQGEGKQWLTKHGNLPEGFSICPVHTGMNLHTVYAFVNTFDLPRIHGDEPISISAMPCSMQSAPYTRG